MALALQDIDDDLGAAIFVDDLKALSVIGGHEGRPTRTLPRTHIVTWYGGEREKVTVIEDCVDYGKYSFPYGTMLIQSDRTTILGEHERYIHFGLYNARNITKI